jgi:hypothetical protein
MTDTETRDLGEVFDEILEGCAEQGMQFPLILCCVSPAGSVLAIRVKGDARRRKPWPSISRTRVSCCR